jgi:probable F420-dependent oxidoreductase
VWTGEHLVLPMTPPAGFVIPSTLAFLDTIVALTLVATHTTTIKVASGIIELPLHHPVSLAKQLASVDQVARGRLIVGIGAGYLEPEFAAMGVGLDERADRMDEHLDAMRALWTMRQPEYHGRHVDFAGVDAHPRPTSAGGPPIVIGGVSAPARRRAVMKADGWYVFNANRERAREAVVAIREDLDRYDRPEHLRRLELTITPSGRFDAGTADFHEELGVDRLVLLPRPDVPGASRHEPVPAEAILRMIDTVATTVLSR